MLDGALPLLGHLAEMYKKFPALCARGSIAHGPLFWIQGGPGARQLMYTDPGSLQLLKHASVSTSFYTEGFSALLGNTLFAFDGDEHRRVRQAMTPPFTAQNVRKSNVMGIVAEAVNARLTAWSDAREFDVVNEIREMTLEIIFRVLGAPVSYLADWRKQYNRFLLAGIPSTGRFHGPLHWYAVRARKWIDGQLGTIVDEQRRTAQTTTLVGAIANGVGEDGKLLDRDLVIANLRLLVFAGHETTASSISWAALHFAASPEFQRRAADEVDGTDDLVALATDGSRFTFAEKMFREALRMYPAVHSVIRRVKAPIALDIGTIPAGALINVPFVHLLRDPERFPQPERFDPDRWKERPRPGTIETAMFGGGPHFCLGYHIAIAEGTLFNLLLARTLRQKNVQLRRVSGDPVPMPIYLPLMHPPRGMTLQLAPNSHRGERHARADP